MEQYMEQARMLAAQCWCDKETSGTEMDTVLAEAIARRISIWMETAYQMARNADFYRGILDECAKHFGEAAYTADDGTVMGEPLLLKVPELVAALVKACEEANDTAKLRAEVARLKAALNMNRRMLTCVYCGHEYHQDTPAAGSEVLTAHIKACERHPMRKAEADIAMLRAALAGLVGADSEQELRQMEAAMRMLPAPDADNVVSINAIHALLATMTPNAAGKALASQGRSPLTDSLGDASEAKG